MKRKFQRAVAWAVIALLALAVIVDAAMMLGFSRGIQYAYNAFFFIVALPGLLSIALKDIDHGMEIH